MTCLRINAAERAQLAMMLEVCAFPKPGNVDRCHDYPETKLEHFLASTIFARSALEEAERGQGRIGEIISHAVRDSNCHKGGNTHFGAFILLVPLVYGNDISGAMAAIAKTDVSDAVAFYKAFSMTSVKINATDELDVHDPHTLTLIRERDMTLLDIMQHSAANDMVAREWVTGFPLTRRGADLLRQIGPGRESIVQTFLTLLATEPDTFVIKKHGLATARETMTSCPGCSGREEIDRGPRCRVHPERYKSRIHRRHRYCFDLYSPRGRMVMGLLKGGINEVIATTAFNAAPMGIHLRDGKATMVLFSGSHTAENIRRDGWLVANFIHDPVIYVKTAFEDLPKEMFVDEPVGDMTVQRLAGTDAWAVFTATIDRTTTETAIVRLTLRKEIIEEIVIHPLNRGFSSIIDATVHATRYRRNRDPKLKELIDYHAGIIRKCGGKREMTALDMLMGFIA